jgi:hypothetical protein
MFVFQLQIWQNAVNISSNLLESIRKELSENNELFETIKRLLKTVVDPYNFFANDILANLCDNNKEFSDLVLNNCFDEVLNVFMESDKPKVFILFNPGQILFIKSLYENFGIK